MMKLAFLCSSLEPGRDGIGDYTLSLAAALRELGHSVLVIGLNDRWLAGTASSPTHASDDGVSLKRLSASLPLAERIGLAAADLKDFQPDWASFQMACYAFDPKGLLFRFNRHLPRLAAVREDWHMYFHELWIGGKSWKHRLVAALQRHSLKRAVRILRPGLLHTNTPLYRALLGRIGIGASVLPHAGSIPVNPDPGTGWFLEVLGENGAPVAAGKRNEHLVGGFFGALYAGWEPEPFFTSLRTVMRKTGRKVTIFSAGRIGGAGEEIWNRLPSAYPDFNFRKLGELSFDRVSQYLRNLDFGIAATPWLVIGKSSATAAMLDHGLPVMVTRNDGQPRLRLAIDPPADPLLILADRDVSDRFLAGLPRREPRHTSQDLAAEFVRQLAAARSAARFDG